MAKSVTIFGAGSWGTALSVHLGLAGRDVTLWARREVLAEEIRETRYNPEYLSDLEIPDSVYVTSNIAQAAQASDLWALAVPSQKFRAVAERIQPYQRSDVRIASLAKGFDSNTLMTMTEVLDGVFESIPQTHIGTLHGPSHAEEVGKLLPTSIVSAAPSKNTAKRFQDAFMTDSLRVLLSTDVTGVEVSGAATNVLAIAAGISDGIGYGDNAKASIITRGFSEIRDLGLAMGASQETFTGLAGLGDLVVTCMSGHSRNRFVGEELGRGKKLDDVHANMKMIAEGVPTTYAIHGLSDRYDLNMPITESVYQILFEGERATKDPELALK